MNNKREPPVVTGRQYNSVLSLMAGEGTTSAVWDKYAELVDQQDEALRTEINRLKKGRKQFWIGVAVGVVAGLGLGVLAFFFFFTNVIHDWNVYL